MYPSSKIGVAAVGFVETVLPLHHHPQMLIVEDEDLKIHVLNLGCCHFLAIHEEAAVAIDVHDHLLTDQET